MYQHNYVHHVNPHHNQHRRWKAVKSDFGVETDGTETNTATTSEKHIQIGLLQKIYIFERDPQHYWYLFSGATVSGSLL